MPDKRFHNSRIFGVPLWSDKVMWNFMWIRMTKGNI